MDEVSKDERTAWRDRGRAPKGFRAEMKGVFIRGKRLSAEGLLTIDGMLANTVIEGAFTGERLFRHMRDVIVSLCIIPCHHPGVLTACLASPLLAISRCIECSCDG
ncbi:hypothetical protein BKA70DRAFT_1109485 [Coprinopsis sp. MPI-PUGE-AT-0042]|nr:hypothetical protein BKA70DRAFT_1109485 [Coprinopsis sp. MPI-PUGE-AT-0042]